MILRGGIALLVWALGVGVSPNHGLAANVTHVVGKVTRVEVFTENYETYDENQVGLLGIYMDELPGACGSVSKRVILRSTHASYQAALAVATTAKALGLTVQLAYLDTCTVRSSAWDFGLIILKGD